MNAWESMIHKEFKQALTLYEEECEKNHNAFNLNNKALALLMLERYDEAITTYQTSKIVDSFQDGYAIKMIGVASWMKEEYENVIHYWKQAFNAHYTDATGGIEILSMLMSAALSTENELLKKETKNQLKKIYKSTKKSVYPMSIASFLLNKLSKEELIASATLNEALKERQLCKVYFYVSIFENEPDVKRDLLKKAVEGKTNFLEPDFFLARNELKRFKLEE